MLDFLASDLLRVVHFHSKRKWSCSPGEEITKYDK
jgi:hypothetical protein